MCNREVAGSNLSRGYFAPRSTQPSILPGSVNEYQLRLGRQMQVWLIPIADERVGVQVKLWNPLRKRAIPERFCGDDSLRRGAISSVCTFTFTFTISITTVVEILHIISRPGTVDVLTTCKVRSSRKNERAYAQGRIHKVELERGNSGDLGTESHKSWNIIVNTWSRSGENNIPILMFFVFVFINAIDMLGL